MTQIGADKTDQFETYPRPYVVLKLSIVPLSGRQPHGFWRDHGEAQANDWARIRNATLTQRQVET